MDVRRSVAEPAFDAEVNLVGFLNLMEAGRRNGLRRVIFSSTGGAIYGEQDTFPCDEDHPTRPVSPYGVAKMATEAYLFFYKCSTGSITLALRYANVYGPRQDPHGEAGVVAIFCGRLARRRSRARFSATASRRATMFTSATSCGRMSRRLAPRLPAAINIGTGVETSVNSSIASLPRSRAEGKAPRPPGRVSKPLRDFPARRA